MSKELSKKYSFVPKEKGSLPRVLLLDFNDDTEKILKENNFQVFSGMSGFTNGKRKFPRDSSEIDIVFWDLSECDFRTFEGSDRNRLPIYAQDNADNIKFIKIGISPTIDDILSRAGKTTENYFDQIREKGGFICVFLGDRDVNVIEVSKFLGFDILFTLKKRYSHRVKLDKTSDIFNNFFKRFINEEKINQVIKWECNKRDTSFYFTDEDENSYAVVAWEEILVCPKPSNLTNATIYLLQEILPNICSEEIYPDLHKYKWIQGIKDKGFENCNVNKIKKEIKNIKVEYVKKIEKLNKELKKGENKDAYLYELLYKDDSNLFDEREKLKDVVKKLLKEDFEFIGVTDMDKERKKLNLALKEDLRINDDVFIEVKGTEKGAKANWVKDLDSHVIGYCCIAKKDINSLKKILIFNHERKKNPLDRSAPFQGNPELLKRCELSKTLLVPIFELFKLTFDIKDNKILKKDARKLILESNGLFGYIRK